MSTAATDLNPRYDDQIQRDVFEELKWDPRVAPKGVGVAVKNGVVTLHGVVDTYATKWAAEDAALRVRGAVAVANELEVQLGGSSRRADEEIAAAALEALESDAVIPKGKVKVTVSNAWVTLSGEAEWQYQRDDAERIVSRLTGVCGVTNSIAVKPRTTPSGLERKIEDALSRNAKLDAQKIRVSAQGGQVALEGSVRSIAESREAEKVAWHAPGVASVENRLEISYV